MSRWNLMLLALVSIGLGASAAHARQLAVGYVNTTTYYYNSKPFYLLMSNPQAQKAIDLTAPEMRDLESKGAELIHRPIQQNAQGNNRMAMIEQLKASGMSYRRASKSELDRALVSVVGKQRFKRLEQIALRVNIRSRQQLFYQITRSNSDLPAIFTPEEIQKAKDVTKKYNDDYRNLRKELGKIDSQKWSKKYQDLRKKYTENQTNCISDATWAKFQNACGEPFGPN